MKDLNVAMGFQSTSCREQIELGAAGEDCLSSSTSEFRLLSCFKDQGCFR